MPSQFLLGDCAHVMQSMPRESVDFILTDPPYLVNYKDRDGRAITNDQKADWLEPAFAQAFRVLKRDAFCVSFYGWTKTDLFFSAWKKAGFRVVGHFTCPKRYASSSGFVSYQHEGAYLLIKGRPDRPENPIPDVLPWQYTGNSLHPTQKPLSALKPLIESFSKPGQTVLDPFAGSGSTCAAAHQLGRSFIGIEIDKRYYDIATKRMNDERITCLAA